MRTEAANGVVAAAICAASCAAACAAGVLRRPPATTRSDEDHELVAAAEGAALAAAAAAEAAERACANTPGCKLLRFLHGHGLNHVFPLFRRARIEFDAVMLLLDEPVAEGDMKLADLGLGPADIAELRMAAAKAESSVGSSQRERDPGFDRTVVSDAISLADVRAHTLFLKSPLADDVVWQREGDTIQSWIIEDPDTEIERGSFIAQGTSARVYSGRWQGMTVAVKIFKPGAKRLQRRGFGTGPTGGASNDAACPAQDDPNDAEADAINEIQLMRRMQHQSLLRLYGACIQPPKCIIVSELCVGSLASLLYGQLAAEAARRQSRPQASGGSSNWSEKLNSKWERTFVRGIATGMAFLHRHNVMHRDLKSANVLVDRGLMPKLCDFAFSTHTATSRVPIGRDNSTASSVGTPRWMAPELLRGDLNVDLKSADVWSFGVVVWEIIHRTEPYKGMSLHAVSYNVAMEGMTPATASTQFDATEHDAPQSSRATGSTRRRERSEREFWEGLCAECWASSQDRPAFDELLDRLAVERFAAAPPPAAPVVATTVEGRQRA